MRQIAFKKCLSLFFIIVKRDDIGDGMLPAVIDNHRSHRIEALRQMIDRFSKMLLCPVRLDVRDAP